MGAGNSSARREGRERTATDPLEEVSRAGFCSKPNSARRRDRPLRAPGALRELCALRASGAGTLSATTVLVGGQERFEQRAHDRTLVFVEQDRGLEGQPERLVVRKALVVSEDRARRCSPKERSPAGAARPSRAR